MEVKGREPEQKSDEIIENKEEKPIIEEIIEEKEITEEKVAEEIVELGEKARQKNRTCYT